MKNTEALSDGYNQTHDTMSSATEMIALLSSDSLLDVTSEERVNALIIKWNQSEVRNGTMLQYKGSEVQKANCVGLAYFLAMATGIIYEPSEKTIWIKESARGLWRQLDEDVLATRILDALNIFIKKALEKDFEFVAKQSLANEIVRRLKNFAAKPGFFEPPREAYVIHCTNCFLLVDAKTGEVTERPLTDETIHSRHQLNVSYVPEASCPQFRQTLLSPIITEDEQRVLAEYLGQVLLGHNISQKVLILSGAAGSGKSTIVNIAEMILNRENVAELRTTALHGGFETSRYIGKSLLVGKDVPADFMRHHGASKVKALTGNDIISTEKKHSNDVSSFSGTLNVIITSNCNQPIRLQDDRDAWERRILSIKCKTPKEAIKPIRDFDKILVDEEGPGILNFALDGLQRIIKAGGTIAASKEQTCEIADLLDESEGVPVFLKNMVEKDEHSDGITSFDLFLAYKTYCQKRGWKPKSVTTVCKELPDAMAELFDEPRRTDIKSSYDGTLHRGYKHVRLKTE